MWLNAAIAFLSTKMWTYVQRTGLMRLTEFASPTGLRSGTILKVDFWSHRVLHKALCTRVGVFGLGQFLEMCDAGTLTQLVAELFSLSHYDGHACSGGTARSLDGGDVSITKTFSATNMIPFWCDARPKQVEALNATANDASVRELLRNVEG